MNRQSRLSGVLPTLFLLSLAAFLLSAAAAGNRYRDSARRTPSASAPTVFPTPEVYLSVLPPIG